MEKRGGLAKAHDYVEVSFCDVETYDECVKQMMESLSCEWDSCEAGTDSVAQICRVSGTKVLDQPFDC